MKPGHIFKLAFYATPCKSYTVPKCLNNWYTMFYLQGAEMLVWYGNGYGQIMGIPIALKDVNRQTANAENQDDEQSE